MKHDYRKPIHYIKRPNYYVYELYSKHFGDILIGVDVNSGGSYTISKRAYKPIKKLAQRFVAKSVKGNVRSAPYLSINASKNENGTQVYLIVINKNMDKCITATIEMKDFVPAQECSAWILNGPGIDATNEISPNVGVTHKKTEIKTNPFKFTFEPHSLTAISIGKHRY